MKLLAKKIGENIRLFREKDTGLSQEAFAWKAKIHTTHLSHIENGDRRATLETLLKICKALHVTLPDIVPGQKKGTSGNAKTDNIMRLILNSSSNQQDVIERVVIAILNRKEPEITPTQR